MVDHESLHTPRVHQDGSLDHYQEALRLLALSEEVAHRTAEGAHAIAAQAQVHATLYAAEVEVESLKLLRASRLQSNAEERLSQRGRTVLRL
jgi:Zn-dependent membrane protease YugP